MSALSSSLLFLASRVISTRGLIRLIFGPPLPSNEPSNLSRHSPAPPHNKAIQPQAGGIRTLMVDEGYAYIFPTTR